MFIGLPVLITSVKFSLELSASYKFFWELFPLFVPSCKFYLELSFFVLVSLGTPYIAVSIRITCLVCHGCKRELCLLCRCLFFWHTSTINAALLSLIACQFFLAQSGNGDFPSVLIACLSR